MSWPQGAGKCQPTPQTLALMDEAAAKARNAVIEECAKVAEQEAARWPAMQGSSAWVAADNIRALSLSRPEGK